MAETEGAEGNEGRLRTSNPWKIPFAKMMRSAIQLLIGDNDNKLNGWDASNCARSNYILYYRKIQKNAI